MLIVQHGDKVNEPGDPGLSRLGVLQAERTARFLLQTEKPAAVVSSPLRRAVETADHLAGVFGLEVSTDDRFRERMNWTVDGGLSFDAFLEEWNQASNDRDYQPAIGDSSTMAAMRALEALDDLEKRWRNETVIVAAHGGVTVDTVRSIVGDGYLVQRLPNLIREGVSSCAITELLHEGDGWRAVRINDTSHNPSQ